MNSAIEKSPDGSQSTYSECPLEEARLFELFQELFLKHWRQIVFGPCISGAVFEIRLSSPPKAVTYSDGYLTVDTGPWHFHLCLGYSKVSARISEELAQQRRVARAAFFESTNKSCVPKSYGFRMWNGAGEQMITLFFPNPYLTEEMKIKKPDWTRLELWKGMKAKYSVYHPPACLPNEK
ncbi:MAG: hypothetical protein HY586_05670 [Candidatus Omnitrophica bacterium]|nr:hypothetical protein [Candidatus Omnitrophota bacterium]